ncbi:MAG: PIG-L family deacetylase [Actinomycetota bacterium]|nr:PIG-L family deacetylase [Actinomycetota bacterium]
MATTVFFHAHPDDECILTGGTMAQLAAAGHRVVLVAATRGEQGEVAPGFLANGETLGERRTKELEAAGQVLGVSRLEFLGYTDSGMMGLPTNDAPACFWQAEVEDAATRLAAILKEESASVLVVYDDHGGYGHPDHIQVHRVGVRAGEMAGTPSVYEATIDRDRVMRMIRARGAVEGAPDLPDLPDIDENSDFGVRATEVTTRLDVGQHVVAKRQAMRCHRSQIADDAFWLTMPDEQFQLAFSEEQYIHRGMPAGTTESGFDLG